jgi:TolB-like protein
MAVRFAALFLAAAIAAIAAAGLGAQEKSRLDRSMSSLSSRILESYGALPNARSRSRIAVLDFEEGSEFIRGNRLGFAMSEMIAAYLIKNGKPLRVVERKQLDSVLSEQELRLSGLLSGDDASRVGELIGVDLLLLGSIVEAGDEFVILARLVETDSGQAILAESLSIPRSELMPEARRYIRVDNRLGLGYRLSLVGSSLEHEAFLAYQYNFLKGLGLGFELSGSLSQSPSERINYENVASVISFDMVSTRYYTLGLGILFEAGPLDLGPLALSIEAGPRVVGYFDTTTLDRHFSNNAESDIGDSSTTSSQVLLGGSAALRAELALGRGWGLGFGLHGRLFADTPIVKKIPWEDYWAAMSGTVTFNDTVNLSGFGAWLGLVYRF